MFHIPTLTLAALCFVSTAAQAFTFDSIDGGTIDLADFAGQPVLVVNTASQCGFTRQLEAMQTLHEDLGPKGLVVLAVPSDDFNQELESAEAVKDFCEVHFGLTLPMTDITKVRGRNAHPFYQWLAGQGAVPKWNFNKALIGPDGELVKFYRAQTRPDDRRLLREINALLPRT